MPMTDDQYVRLRAYQLWVQEGRPKGREYVHWHKARLEVEPGVSRAERSLGEHSSQQQAGGMPKGRP